MKSNEHKPMYKLLSGLVMFYGYCFTNQYIGGADGLHKLVKHMKAHLSMIPGALAGFISEAFGFALCCAMLYFVVVGAFRIVSFRFHIKEFER